MDGSFEGLVNFINESSTKEELVKSAEKWLPDIDNYDFDYWVDNIFSENIDKIDFNKLPDVLEVFYKSEDKFVFMLFCMILESTIDGLPYLANLEEERLFVGKWEVLKGPLSNIIKNSKSALVDCMFLILLNNDPMGEYLTDEEKDNIVFGINDSLDGIYNYLTNEEEIDLSIYNSLEIVLDAATFLNDDKTVELAEKIGELDVEIDPLIFLIKFQLANGIDVKEENIDKVMMDDVLRSKLFYVLESVGKLDMLKDKIEQEDIAAAKMIEWLVYPTELGELPTGMQCLEVLEIDGLDYYLFKFKTNVEKLKDNDYMLGVVGGFEKNKLTAECSGIVFSNFEKVSDDYISQGKELIKTVQDYWKNRAE